MPAIWFDRLGKFGLVLAALVFLPASCSPSLELSSSEKEQVAKYAKDYVNVKIKEYNDDKKECPKSKDKAVGQGQCWEQRKELFREQWAEIKDNTNFEVRGVDPPLKLLEKYFSITAYQDPKTSELVIEFNSDRFPDLEPDHSVNQTGSNDKKQPDDDKNQSHAIDRSVNQTGSNDKKQPDDDKNQPHAIDRSVNQTGSNDKKQPDDDKNQSHAMFGFRKYWPFGRRADPIRYRVKLAEDSTKKLTIKQGQWVELY